jgi:hypothetical protein
LAPPAPDRDRAAALMRREPLYVLGSYGSRRRSGRRRVRADKARAPAASFCTAKSLYICHKSANPFGWPFGA